MICWDPKGHRCKWAPKILSTLLRWYYANQASTCTWGITHMVWESPYFHIPVLVPGTCVQITQNKGIGIDHFVEEKNAHSPCLQRISSVSPCPLSCVCTKVQIWPCESGDCQYPHMGGLTNFSEPWINETEAQLRLEDTAARDLMGAWKYARHIALWAQGGLSGNICRLYLCYSSQTKTCWKDILSQVKNLAAYAAYARFFTKPFPDSVHCKSVIF